MPSFKTPEQKLKFAKLLITMNLHELVDGHGEFKISDEDCTPDLITAITTCDQLFGDRFPFATAVSDTERTRIEYWPQLVQPINNLFLDFLIVMPSATKPGHHDVYFNMSDAETYWVQYHQQLKPLPSLARTHNHPENYGVVKKALNSLRGKRYQLERDAWLNDEDINQALKALGLDKKVLAGSFQQSTIQGHLERERERHSDTPHVVYFILSLGGSANPNRQGNHWIRVKVEVNPEDQTLFVTYRDTRGKRNTDLFDPKHPNRKITNLLLNSTSEIYPTFKPTVYCVGPEEIEQPRNNDWICGYLVLFATDREIATAAEARKQKKDGSSAEMLELREFKYTEEDAKATSDHNFIQAFRKWNFRYFEDLRDSVFKLILRTAKVSDLDYIAFADDKPLQHISFQISDPDAARPFYKLNVDAIDAVLYTLVYDLTARQVLINRGLLAGRSDRFARRAASIDFFTEVRNALRTRPDIDEALDKRQFLIVNRR